MAYIVKCLLCEKDLQFNRSDPSLLWTHIKTDHPLVNLNEPEENRKSVKEVNVQELIENIFEQNFKNLNNCVEKSVQTESLDWSRYFRNRKMAASGTPRQSQNSSFDSPASLSTESRDESKNSSFDSGNQNISQSPQTPSIGPSMQSNQFKTPLGATPKKPPRATPQTAKKKLFSFSRQQTPSNGSLIQSNQLNTPLGATPKKPPSATPQTAKKKPYSFSRQLSPDAQRESLPLMTTTKQSIPNRKMSAPNPIASNSREDFLEKTIVDSDKDQKVLYKREYVPVEPIKQDKSILRKKKNSDWSAKKTKLYKTSIEKWRPGGSKITCPNCGIKKRPIIKSHASRVAQTAFGANLILTCWPFCFSPCLFPPPREECLHCAICNYYLGMYDHRKEVITPNPDVNETK